MDSERSESYLDLYERYSDDGSKYENIYGHQSSNPKVENNNINSSIGLNNSNPNASISQINDNNGQPHNNNNLQPSNNNNSQLPLNNNIQIRDNRNVLPPNASNQIINEIRFQIVNNKIGQFSNAQLPNNNLKAQSPSIDYSINSINQYIKGSDKQYYISIIIFFKLL